LIKLLLVLLRASTSSKKSVFTIVAEPYRPVELIDIYIYYNDVYYFFILNSKLNFFKMLLTMVFFIRVFLIQLNVHTFNCHHRADRGVEGWFEVWVDRWVEREGRGEYRV